MPGRNIFPDGTTSVTIDLRAAFNLLANYSPTKARYASGETAGRTLSNYRVLELIFNLLPDTAVRAAQSVSVCLLRLDRETNRPTNSRQRVHSRWLSGQARKTTPVDISLRPLSVETTRGKSLIPEERVWWKIVRQFLLFENVPQAPIREHYSAFPKSFSNFKCDFFFTEIKEVNFLISLSQM